MKHLLPVLKEMFSKNKLVRVTEPMIMNDEDQTQQYYQYGLGDTTLRAAYLFHARRASQTIQNCRRVLDLGTGPANQLSIIAQYNPQVQFVGVDLSDKMIAIAKKNCSDLGLKNVSFIQDDITKLSKIEDQSFDGVMSSVALHHLNSVQDLEATFKNVNRVLSKNGSVYITDFLLVKNPETIDYLVSLNANQPELFRLDYENSLKACFTENDYRRLRDQYLPQVEVQTTFGAKFLMVMKTKSSPLKKEIEAQINDEVKKLGKENKSVVRSLSTLFCLNQIL